MKTTRTAIALTIIAVVTACGGDEAAPSPAPSFVPPPPDSVVSSGPLPPGPAQITPSPVVPTPGQIGVYPIRWDHVTVGDDDRTVQVSYTTGVPPCTVLDHVDVEYGTGTVTITLYEGHAPDDGTPMACPEIAMFAMTTVVLDQPLAGRTIIDGAEKGPPD